MIISDLQTFPNIGKTAGIVEVINPQAAQAVLREYPTAHPTFVYNAFAQIPENKYAEPISTMSFLILTGTVLVITYLLFQYVKDIRNGNR